MKVTIESILSPIDGYLSTLKRDTEHGWYILEVGIPAKWSYNENDLIGVSIIYETDEGKLIKVYPKSDGLIADDLIDYVKVVVETNKLIEDKEQEFQKQLEIMKEEMVKKASEYYKNIDNMKKTSFDNITKEKKVEPEVVENDQSE